MSSQLNILSKVMSSLEEDQTVAMDNIQALLNNRGSEINITSKIKHELFNLAKIETAMSQNKFFMIQIAENEEKSNKQQKSEKK